MKESLKQNKVKQKRDGFVMLPRYFIGNEILTPRDREFCLILAYHRNNHTKLCCPKRSTICKEAGFSLHTYYKIRFKLQKIGLISYKDSSGGRKQSVEFKLNWLDGSNEEIDRIKRVLKAKKPVQKSIGLTDAEMTRLTDTGLTQKPVQSSTPNYKEFNNNKYQQQEESVAVNSSFSIKPETQKKLREWHISNGNIRELILQVMKFSDNIDEYFQDWIAFIKENPKIKNPAGYLIKMVEEKSEPHKEKLSYAQNQINLREAKIDLEKSCTADRIYEWLKKIDRPYHSELQKHLKRIYPEGKAYFEAEIRYDREKVR